MDGMSATRFVVTNVPWDNTYRHVMWFGGANSGGVTGSTARRNAYFEALPKAVDVSDFNFVKFGEGYVDVQRSWNVLRQNNYIWWINNSGGASGTRPFYAFITEMVVLNTRVTRIYYELDVMQSFGINLRFQQSFIHQCHLPANREFQNRESEGLDIGAEYFTLDARPLSQTALATLIIVTKQPFVNTSGSRPQSGTIFNGTPDSLCYYAIPFRRNNNNPITFNGQQYSQADVINFMRSLVGEGALAVQAANNIVNLYVVPGLIRPNSTISGTNTHLETVSFDSGRRNVRAIRLWDTRSVQVTTTTNIRRLNSNYPANSPLQRYPYLKYLITDNNGGVLELKPELFGRQDAHWVDWTIIIGPTPTTIISPRSYNTSQNFTLASDSPGMTSANNAHRVMQGMISNTQYDVSYPSDMLGAFIQGNKNQLKAQQQTNYEDLKWKQAVRGFNYDRQALANRTNMAQSGIELGKNLAFAGAGALQAKATLGLKGGDMLQQGALGAIGSGFDLARNIQNQNTLAGNNQLMAGRELEDYAQKARAIQAQKDDIANLPPNVTVAHNNLHMLMALDLLTPMVYVQAPHEHFLQRINSYHHYYGMIWNNYETPNLTQRPFWNYIKMGQANITGDVPEIFLAVIRQIFENGVTLWRSDMYNYNRGNR